MADIYAGALSAKGVKVSKKLQIGERPVYIKALQDGSIDMVPEYSGSILSYFDKSATATSPEAVYAALQQKLPTTLAVLNFAQAEDKDTIVVTQDTATKYNLRTLADLCPVAGQLTLGAPKQFQTRPDGVPALKSIYGINFKAFKPLDTGGPVTVSAPAPAQPAAPVHNDADALKKSSLVFVRNNSGASASAYRPVSMMAQPALLERKGAALLPEWQPPRRTAAIHRKHGSQSTRGCRDRIQL